jgi:hypothetical protein
MRRTMPTEPLRPEMVRAARAAFPDGHRYLWLAEAPHTLLRSIQARCMLAKPTTVPVVRSTRPPGPFLALRHEALKHNHVPAFSTHEGVVRVQVRRR